MSAELQPEHKVDEDKPHWRDFYVNYERYISTKEIRPNRKLSILHIPHENKSAPYVFFVHGAMARMSQFEYLIESLSSKLNIIAFDRIGCGYSDKPEKSDAYHGVAIFADLCEIWKQYMPQTTIHDKEKKEILVIGHSFGCSQIIRLISKFGDSSVGNYSIRSVILIGAHPFIIGANIGYVGKALFSLPNCVLESMSSSLSKSFRQKAIHSNSTKINELELSFGGYNKPVCYSPFYLQIVACSENEFKTFCNYGINTMMIHGKHDGLVKVKTSNEIYNKFMKFHDDDKNYLMEFHIVDNASHQSMQEQPDIVNNMIDKFWSKSVQK